MPKRIFNRKTLLALILALGVIQPFPVDESNPPSHDEITIEGPAKDIIKAACYDCHSNDTVWPWYSKIAPISWLVANDVKEGRAELNFSEWGTYTAKRQGKKLKEIVEEIDEGEMAPLGYRILHPEARLTDEQQQVIKTWVSQQVDRLANIAQPSN